MKSFLHEFLDLTKSVESPTQFMKWAFYTMVGAILRDNVYFEFPSQQRKICPNLYVFIIADSGASRKSNPFRWVSYYMQQINNTKFIHGRTSIQGIIKELGSVWTINKKPIRDASCLLFSEEYASFLVNDPQTNRILCDIYDYRKQWDHGLKTEDRFTLNNLCVSFLAATNEEFLKDMFSEVDLKGGLVARMCLIYGDGARRKSSGMFDSDINEDQRDKILHHLLKLSRLQGRVNLTEEAKEFYDKWYVGLEWQTESGTGFEHRFHTAVIKLAIILAACEEGFNMVIEKRHIEEAIAELGLLLPNYRRIMRVVGPAKNNTGKLCAMIMKYLATCKNYRAERPELIRSLLTYGVDDLTFEKTVNTLIQAKLIEQMSISGKTAYQITKLGQEEILENTPTKTTLN